MKAFVIKNKEGEYLQYFDTNSDDIRFTDDLTLAELYDKNEKDIMEKAYSNMGWEYIEITLAETKDLKQDINESLEQQLAEKDKEIEKLYKIIDSQKRHIANTEKYFKGRGTKRTGNVILDFELLIRKQVCDEIKKVIEYHSEWYEQGYVINMVVEDLLKEIDKIEQAKDNKDVKN